MFRNFLPKGHVLFELAVAVRNTLVGVAKPKANQVFWRVLLPKPRCAESPECVSARFGLSQLI